jgi:probable rRNA maturation factor
VKHRIHLREEQAAGPAGRRAVAAARMALTIARSAPAEMTLVFTDSRRIRRLNARFAGEDHVTDVLAFPAEPERARPLPSRRYLGDVVISVPRARRQARRRGLPLVQELSLLAVHGTLHLLGHDHASRRSRQRMWRLQRSAVHRLGFDPERLGFEE